MFFFLASNNFQPLWKVSCLSVSEGPPTGFRRYPQIQCCVYHYRIDIWTSSTQQHMFDLGETQFQRFQSPTFSRLPADSLTRHYQVRMWRLSHSEAFYRSRLWCKFGLIRKKTESKTVLHLKSIATCYSLVQVTGIFQNPLLLSAPSPRWALLLVGLDLQFAFDKVKSCTCILICSDAKHILSLWSEVRCKSCE